MHPAARYAVALGILIPVQLLVYSTLLYWLRRHHGVQPAWSWWKMLGAFTLLSLALALIGAVLGIIPRVGAVLAGAIGLVGIKRLSGMSILGTVLVAFSLSVAFFALTIIVGRHFDVDLFGWGTRVE